MKLDIGCGGNVVDAPEQPKIRGDVNCDLYRPRIRIDLFVQCDAQHLPFRPRTFSNVCMYDVLEHLDAPSLAITEILRVLAEGGRMEVGTPNALWLPKIVRGVFRGFYSVWHTHIATWGGPELKQLCEKAGFKTIQIKYASYLTEHEKFHYDVLVALCPFPILKHRQVIAYGVKN